MALRRKYSQKHSSECVSGFIIIIVVIVVIVLAERVVYER